MLLTMMLDEHYFHILSPTFACLQLHYLFYSFKEVLQSQDVFSNVTQWSNGQSVYSKYFFFFLKAATSAFNNVQVQAAIN